MSTKWIGYIDKTTYDSKLLDLDIVQPAVMDDLELPLTTPTNPLDDASIGGAYSPLTYEQCDKNLGIIRQNDIT